MDIYEIGMEDELLSVFQEEPQKVSSWNNHIVQQIQPDMRMAFAHLQKTNSIKPLMGCTRGFEVEAEAGYTERDGIYAKVDAKWKFGPSDKNESKNEPESTSKETGEVNSTDRN